MLEFAATLKGALAQVLIYCLLRQAGYPVVQTSIEVLLPGLSLLDRDGYAALGLSKRLRLMPDLLILPRETPSQLLEIKYRSRLDREVLRLITEKLREQQTQYPEAVTVLIRGTSPKGAGAQIDDLVRVLPEQGLERLAAADLFYHHMSVTREDLRLEPLWSSLRTLTSAFPLVRDHRAELERLPLLIRTIAQL